MGTMTFKTRQKEAARREKQQKKLARRLERKRDKANMSDVAAEDNVQTTHAPSEQG